MFTCICGFSHDHHISMGMHKQKCQQFLNYVSETLTQEFFDQKIGIGGLSLNKLSNDMKGDIPARVTIKEALKYGYSTDKKYVKKESSGTTFTQEFFDKYIGQNDMLLTDITEKVLKNEFSYVTVLNYAKKFGYGAKSRSEAAKAAHDQGKNSETIMDRFGFENVSQVKDIHNKKEETFLKNYGFKNIFCDAELMKVFYLQKFGVDNPSKVEEIELKKQTTMMSHYGFPSFGMLSTHNKVSKVSQRLFDMIYEKLNHDIVIDCDYYNLTKERFVKHNNKNMYLDFSIIHGDTKLSIEFNGDFWHANPKTHQPYFYNEISKMTASEIWAKDTIRYLALSELGFKNLIIWESEFFENPEETVNICIQFITHHAPHVLL